MSAGADAQYVIGHDVGTGGCKSVLADSEGRLLATAFQPYETCYPEPRWAEQDPADWWAAVTAGTRLLLSESGLEPSRVSGIGFAGQMIGLVPVGSGGEPLTPAIIWLDSRADAQAECLVRRLGGKRIFAAVAGAVASGKDVVCKIAWLRENEPSVFAETRAFLDTTGYLVLKATGELSIDHTGAGGTGLLSNRTRRFSPLLARLCSVPLEKMPPLKRSIDVVAGLSAEAARDMGLPEGTPVIAGMADIPAAATGSGALHEGDAHVYLGTSSWLCLSLSRPVNIPKNGIVSVAGPDPEMFIMLGESETAGMCLEWFADRLVPDSWRAKGPVFEAMGEAAGAVEPGCRGLIFAPWMYGERAPVTDTTLRGAFVNLSLDHTLEHLLRSVYEGVAYNLRWMMEAVERKGMPVRSVRAIGGGARSDTWMQVMADVTGRVVEAMEDPQEAGAKGCAMAVAVALGALPRYRDIKRVLAVRRRFEPDPACREVYEPLYEAFKRLHPALSGVSRRLSTLG